MAHRSDRRGDAPIESLAIKAVQRRLVPHARIPYWPGAMHAPHRGRRYVCSPITVRSRHHAKRLAKGVQIRHHATRLAKGVQKRLAKGVQIRLSSGPSRASSRPPSIPGPSLFIYGISSRHPPRPVSDRVPHRRRGHGEGLQSDRRGTPAGEHPRDGRAGGAARADSRPADSRRRGPRDSPAVLRGVAGRWRGERPAADARAVWDLVPQLRGRRRRDSRGHRTVGVDGVAGVHPGQRRETPRAPRAGPRSPSEYWRRPRCERRGASCEARRRGDAPAHRRGGATRQMAPRRRNPKGAWGLRPQTASHVVADALRHRLLRASCLQLARPTRAAHANTRTDS